MSFIVLGSLSLRVGHTDETHLGSGVVGQAEVEEASQREVGWVVARQG